MNIAVQWDTVDCIDRNSEITGYVLRYGEASSDQREEETVTAGSGDEGGTSTITGLVPYTEYAIEVAAVNGDSQTGPYANITTQTLQDSELKTYIATSTLMYSIVSPSTRPSCVLVSHPLPHLPPTHLVCSPPAQWGHHCI